MMDSVLSTVQSDVLDEERITENFTIIYSPLHQHFAVNAYFHYVPQLNIPELSMSGKCLKWYY